ncbi:hypothetical protein OYT00_01945 [Microbacterium paraoxydans]|uniref:hypothetical protein n=1 Tax=Microbacterium paraoxydans TaxID=199592 RepID=UPI0022866583|nr:hypothetical protein [Microbacterium paraoxydans]MCZ0708749.1 hypothetical protein [Microbacterium paraoxydans]
MTTDPKPKPATSQTEGDHLAGGSKPPSVWHETPRLPSTIDGARTLYGDDLFEGGHG